LDLYHESIQDLPPEAIPNEAQMRGAVHVSPRRRKAFWIKQWRFEQALLNRRLILGGDQKQSTDEQRVYERQRRHQKPLMERFKEQRRRIREDKLEMKLAKCDRQALKERKRIRRENERRRILQAVLEQAEREERRRIRREIRENERRRLLQVADQQAREE
jgi:hypothetical protein